MTSATQESRSEKGLARVAQSLASWTEKWFPDAYVFALVGVVAVVVAPLANGSSPQTVVNAFGDGFWDLTAFTLQMAMVVLTGYVVATCAPAARLIDRLATMPQTARSAVSFVAFLSMSVSFLNWGLSLVFGGLLARAIARRTDLRVDYRALGAAAFMGLGAVWALGMSSSAAQLQATADSLPPELLKIHERLIAEREVLQPLPSLRLQIGVPSVLRKVDRLSCVRYASARYSVPAG